MNAVMRRLALLAATVAIGACSGDPTADSAGADLTIRATPGVVWMQQQRTQTILLEAIDATGAPAPGNWTFTTTGVASAVADTGFEHTSTGNVGQGRQYVISASAEGNGTVVFTGTGGTITIPVRAAPDPAAFHATVSNKNPAIAEQITVTAPAGLRFMASAKADFVSGPIVQNGLASPAITGMSADSTSLTILPAPGAAGHIRISGISSIQTPTLGSTASTVDSVTVPSLDTMSATFSTATPAVNTPMTITANTNFGFRSTSGISSNNIEGIVTAVSADSQSMTIIPSPGTAGAVTVSDMVFSPIAALSLTLPTATTITVPAAPDLGADDPFGAGTVYAFDAPTVIGTRTGVFDANTQGAPDYVGDGGIATSQFLIVNFPTAGSYHIELSWDNNADADLFMIDLGFNSILAQSFNGAGEKEEVDYDAAAGDGVFLEINMFAGTAPSMYRVAVTRTQ